MVHPQMKRSKTLLYKVHNKFIVGAGLLALTYQCFFI